MATRPENSEDLLTCLYLIISVALKSQNPVVLLAFLEGMGKMIREHSEVWHHITEEEYQLAEQFGAQMFANVEAIQQGHRAQDPQ